MAETKVSKKTKSDIQLTDMSNKEKDTKVKSTTKKTKVKDETLEPKDEPLDSVKAVADCVVDVEQSSIAASELAEIDLRSYNHSDVVGGYIRRKRSI